MEIHHHSLLRALFLFLLCCLLATTSTCTLKPLDRHGIQSFLANVKNLDFDWGSDHDVCSFRGILCKRERIISINLNKRGLTGYLGSARYLTALEVLSLEGNALYGRIPSISGLQNLTRLDLSGNSFTSFTHDFLRNLPSLEHLYLENLPLQPWTIPDSVAGCNYLQYLHASNSSITGGFPLALAHVTSLLELSLSGNQLSGVLPSWVGGFVSITWLDLAGQNMSGPVEVLSKLTNLEDLVLSENQFSGSIPDLSALKNLQLFWADSNLFSGLVPENMSSMAKMKSLNLANNFLQGPLPSFPNRPLKTIAIKSGDVGPCGVSVPTLNKDQLWEFHPNKLGVRDAIANGHLYADTELELEFQGIKKEFTMLHTWPLWTPRRVPSKLAADMPLLKGQLTMTLPDGREESVMKITAFVANTSNMPVAACEISINTGQTGSLKIVGSVSSRGEDLGDPVTSATLSIVQVFWELEKKLAQRKHFPSVNWLISHSKYPMAFESFYGKFNSDFIDTRTRAREVLQREDDLNETVQLVGKDALGEGDNITLETAKLLLEDYLVHNAFTLYDKYCPFYKSVWMMCNIIHFNTLANQAVERAANAGGEGHKITYSVVKSRMPDLFYRLLSQKYEDPAEGEDVLLVKFQKLYDDLTTGFRNLKDEAR
ncbi:hypothetical protein ACQ4PT_020572 [Festuca glaucescens]